MQPVLHPVGILMLAPVWPSPHQPPGTEVIWSCEVCGARGRLRRRNPAQALRDARRPALGHSRGHSVYVVTLWQSAIIGWHWPPKSGARLPVLGWSYQGLYASRLLRAVARAMEP